MLPYILELIIIFVAAVLGAMRTTHARLWYLGIVFTVLFLVSGLRGVSVGSDTLTYSFEFYQIANNPDLFTALSRASITAPIYVAYNWVIGQFTQNYQVILLINAAVISLGVARLIYKTSSNVPFSAFCFIGLAAYFQSMNGMRQYIAVVIAINAYLYFAEYGYKSIRGWILFLLAVGVHPTALVLLLAIVGVFYIRSKDDSKKAIRILAVASIACLLLIDPLVNLFVSVFPYFAIFQDGSKYDILGQDGSGRIVLLYVFLAIIVILAYFKLGNEKLSYEREPAAFLFPVVMLAVVLGFAFSKSFLMNRMVWFFIIGFVPFIPYAFKKYSPSSRTLMGLVTVAVLLAWCFMQLFENKSAVVPYVLG